MISQQELLPVQDINETDYSIQLEGFQVVFTADETHIRVGDSISGKGWALHLSAVTDQREKLLNQIIPELSTQKVSFKLARNSKVASAINNGYTGPGRMGKFITLYPRTEQQGLTLAKKLIGITDNFRGPDIPGAFRLSGVVYASYENRDELSAEEVNSAQRTIPDGISWPFGEIAQPLPKEKIVLYNGKYKPIQILKADGKGAVYKAVFIAGFLRLQRCILKEARMNMSSDKFGRTIQDRLEWQYHLYKEFAGKLPVPRSIDLFKMNEDLYFVMEFIDGTPLETFISQLFTGYHSWTNLPKTTKLRLTNVLLDILKIVQQLHDEGLIHRDLTVVNLMIGKKDKLYLIDMELTYSMRKNYPSPPFRGGTPGYSSPEQTRNESPTTKEDIYGIGGLMVYFFCGFSPTKLDLSNGQQLTYTFHFLTGNKELSSLMSACLAADPESRPSLHEILLFIENLNKRTQDDTGTLHFKVSPLEPECTQQLITSFLEGLTDPLMVDAQNLWTTLPTGLPGFVAKLNRGYVPALANGAGGGLYLIAKTYQTGYRVPELANFYTHNWQYLEHRFLRTDFILSPGILEGSAGLALVIREGLQSGLLANIDSNHLVSIVARCLSNLPQRLAISDGLAGIGLAINQSRGLLGEALLQDLTTRCLVSILEQQQKNGYWITVPEMLKQEGLILGLGFGTAGVLYYLLDCLENNVCPPETERAVLRGLDWLIKQAEKSPNALLWTVGTKSKKNRTYNTYSGVSGIILCFLKAYAYFKDHCYKEIATRGFNSISKTLYPGDLSQISGLAGVGEVYLEGMKILQNEEWQERADWIARFFHASFLQSKECRGYWSMDEHNTSSAMLLTGCSGIAHFLLRYLHPEKVNFCILQS